MTIPAPQISTYITGFVARCKVPLRSARSRSDGIASHNGRFVRQARFYKGDVALHKGNWSNPLCDIARPRRMTTPIFSAAEIRRFIDTGFLRLDDAFPRELAAATRRARRRASA